MDTEPEKEPEPFQTFTEIEPEPEQGQSSQIKAFPSSVFAFDIPTPGSLDEWDEEYFQNMADCFYSTLKSCLSSVLKKPKASFTAYKNILLVNLTSLEQAGGIDRVKPYRQLLEDFEKDVYIWRDMNNLNIQDIANQEATALISQSQEKQAIMQAQLESLQAEINELVSSKAKIGEDRDLSSQALISISQQKNHTEASMKKAQEEMLKIRAKYNKAEALLKTLLPQIKVIEKDLDKFDKQHSQVQDKERQAREKFEATERELEEVKKSAAEEIKLQSLARAEAKKKQDLAEMENKLNFYVEHPL